MYMGLGDRRDVCLLVDWTVTPKLYGLHVLVIFQGECSVVFSVLIKARVHRGLAFLFDLGLCYGDPAAPWRAGGLLFVHLSPPH